MAVDLATALQQLPGVGKIRSPDNPQLHADLAGDDGANEVSIAGAKSVTDYPGRSIDHLGGAWDGLHDKFAQLVRKFLNIWRALRKKSFHFGLVHP